MAAAFGLGCLTALQVRLRTDGTSTTPISTSMATGSVHGPRILVAHEQHLQRVGSDTRLLALIKGLIQRHGAEVSLLVRTRKCNHCVRNPPTHELARILKSTATEALPLPSLHPTPAIFEFNGTDALYSLLTRADFDMVLVGLWFWYDPQPSFAELIAPVVRAHADHMAANANGGVLSGRPPLLALLNDDAHAERARRLAEEELDPEQAAVYQSQASNLAARQRALYAAVDAVYYLTGADRDAEAGWKATPAAASGGQPPHIGLLRMAVDPPRAVTDGSTTGAPTLLQHGGVHDGSAPRIGFVGDGHTPTNALGVQRFLREGWGALRREWPGARLRVVGRIPTGHRAGSKERAGGKDAPCSSGATADAPTSRCGWGWGTPCAANESAACGVDALGYLSDEALEQEASTWSLVVAPIFATTGANTKLLFALSRGLPVVATRAAAAPFGIDGGGGGGGGGEAADHPAAALGTTALDLARWCATLLGDRRRALQIGAAGHRHYAALMQSTDADDDVGRLLEWVRSRRPQQLAPLAHLAAPPQRPHSPLPRCHAAAPSQHDDGDSPVLLAVSACGLSSVWPQARRLRAVWSALCRECGWKCAWPPHDGALPERWNRTTLLVDDGPPCTLHPTEGRGAHASRFVLLSRDPSNARELYHRDGNALPAMLTSERLAAATPAATAQAASGGGRHGRVVRVDRMASRAGWRRGWRDTFGAFFGSADAASTPASVDGAVATTGRALVERLVTDIAEPMHARLGESLAESLRGSERRRVGRARQAL